MSVELPPPSYDESAVPAYSLPPLLRAEDGSAITDALDFSLRRRSELLELFRRHVFGRVEAQLELGMRRVSGPEACCGGLGLRSELDVELSSPLTGARLSIRVLVHTPSAATAPSPAFLGLNLFGNHTLHADSRIRLAAGWLPENAELGLLGNVATQESRGVQSGRWPVEAVLARGYALVTAYAGDIDPDFDDGFRNGLHALLAPAGNPRPADAPGTIAAWAFGLSRILDALERLPELAAERVAVIGHSRLGKTALWAAAQDPRFALCISNESGCGGAALSRRRYGERLLHINRRFPHWFCSGFQAYNEREHALPIDQHQLLALIAPRPLYVASAAQDQWADPRGEWLACQAAAPAYELFGHRVAPRALTAPAERAGESRIGYHVRPGRHDLTPLDFWHYLQFADRWL